MLSRSSTMLKQLIGAQERKKMMLTPIKMLRNMVVGSQSGADCHNDDHIEDSSTYVIKMQFIFRAITLSYIELSVLLTLRL